MKLPWKKNFFKIPESLIADSDKITTDYILIGCIKIISKRDIKSGVYKHIGITMDGEDVQCIKQILPNTSVGRYSKYNTQGRVIKRRDLPKVPYTYYSEAPNYKNSGTHTTSHDVLIWQKEKWLPRFIEIKTSILDEKEDSIIFKFELDTILNKNNVDFMKDFLFHINLLQENCGRVNVLDINSSDDYLKNLYVDWEILPPGERNLTSNIHAILSGYKKTNPELHEIIKDRLEFFEELNSISIIHGMNSFNHYFGALLKDDIVLFENVKYGNAIYIFYEDWQDLSKMSRTELLNSNSRKFERINHTSSWKSSVRNALKDKR